MFIKSNFVSFRSVLKFFSYCFCTFIVKFIQVTVDPHYWWIFIFVIHLVTKTSLKLQNQYSKHFVEYAYAQSGGENLGHLSASCFSSHTVRRCPFHGIFSAIFFHIFVYCWWFHCLKWSRVEVLSSVPKCKKAVMYLTKKIHIRFLQIGVLVLLAMNSMFTNQQYILNKVSLNRKTHKRRLDVDQLVEMMWPEAHRNLTPKNHNSVYAKFSFRGNFIEPKRHSKYEIYENSLYLIFLVAVVNEVFSINISSNWSLLVCMKTVLIFNQWKLYDLCILNFYPATSLNFLFVSISINITTYSLRVFIYSLFM